MKYLKQQRGFTLIEVLVTLVLLAIGILALAAMQVTSTRGNFSSKNLTQGTYVAQEGLEFLKNIPFDSPQLQAGSYGDGSTTISGLAFNRSYTVVPNGNCITIHYMVTWNDGTDHDVTLSTVRSQ